MRSVRLLVANLKGSPSVKCGGFFVWLAILSFLSLLLAVQAQSTNIPTYNAGEISFTTDKFTAGEGDGTALITLTRNDQWGIVLVDLIVTDGGATNGVNYKVPGTNTIIFSNLQTRATLPITIMADNKTNTNSLTVSLTLTNARPATNQFLTVAPAIAAKNNKAQLQILDKDKPYQFNLQNTWYQIDEDAGQLSVGVVLAAPPGDGASDVSVDYEVRTDQNGTKAGSDYATAGEDYEAQSGTLTFGSTDQSMLIPINILSDKNIEFNEDFHVVLTAAHGKFTPPADPNSTNPAPADINFALGPIAKSTVTILYNGSTNHPQPAGAVDLTWNADNDKNTTPAFNVAPGANNTVFAIAPMIDGKAYIAGVFTSVNAESRVGIARLKADGQVDLAFEPLGGANDFITAIAVYTNTLKDRGNLGKLIIGGGFSSVNGIQRNGIAKLNADGSLDASFDPGNGANGPIYSIALQFDGSILVAGDFTAFDGVLVNRVARLLPNGQLDLNYQPGLGPNAPVFSIISHPIAPIQIDRGQTNGPETAFQLTVDTGANAGMINLSFSFTETNDFTVLNNGQRIYFSDLTNNLVTITNQDGSTTNVLVATVTNIAYTNGSSLTFLINSLTNAASNWVFKATIQPDAVLGSYIGGDFTDVNGTPVGRIARLNPNGQLDTTFTDGTGIAADDTVYSLARQSDGKIIAGGAFTTFNSFDSTGVVRLNTDGTFDRNFAVGIGVTDVGGPGAVKAVSVMPNDKILIAGKFSYYNYSRRLFLARLLKDGELDTSFLDPAFNQFAGFPGPDGDYPSGLLESVAWDNKGNVLVGGRFTRVGGGKTRTDIHTRVNVARLHGDNPAAVTPGPGNVSFVAKTFGADENAGALAMILGRTNGALGPVNLQLGFVDGAAIDKLDYTNKPVSITFPVIGPNQADGATSNIPVQVGIIDDQLIEGDEDFTGTLTFPVSRLTLGGEFIPTAPALGPISQAQGLILDDDVQSSTVFFSQNEYDFDENSNSVTVNVYRTGNTSVAGTVRYSTVPLTESNAATPDIDYVSASGAVSFSSGQTNKTITLKLRDDALAEPDESFAVALSAPTSGITIAKTNNSARINIIDNDYAPGHVTFTATNYNVLEGDTATLTVKRNGGNVGILQVNYTTHDGTASAPFDYTEQSGTLFWNDQESGSKTIQIPVSDNGIADGTRVFSVSLSDVSPNGSLGIRTNVTVSILDNDALGSFSFNAKQYLADENGTNVIVNVIRRGGSSGVATVNYSTANSGTTNSAVAGQDYVATSGTLTFGIGETSKSFPVTLIDNTVVNPERLIGLVLTNAQPNGALLGPITNATIAIIDNESLNIPAGGVETDFNTDTGANNSVQAISLQADGKILIGGDFQVVDRQVRTFLARINGDGTLDPNFGVTFNINDSVRAIEVQKDNRIVVGGAFTNVNGFPVNHIARFSSAGILDSTFNIGAGADGPVFAIKQVIVGGEPKVLMAGGFSVFNGVARRGIARANDNGKNDSTFDPGSGVNGTIYAMGVQTDGKILLGGEFSTINGVPRINIARLNADGSLDTTFDAGLGADGPVRSLLIEYDDKIIVGGVFNNIAGIRRSNIARFNTDGTVDISFNPGAGASGPVYALGLQLDGKIIAAGDFATFNGVPQGRIARLNYDGSLDTSVNFGTGANGFIAAVAIQPDRKIVVGGGFTQFDNLPRNHFARLYGGSIQGPGELMFAAPIFSVNENSTNAVISVRRYGGLSGAVSATYLTQGVTASPGADYQDVSGVVSFASGENYKTFTVPIIDDVLVEDPESVQLVLTNAVGSLPLKRQPVASLSILSDDSIIEFRDIAYNVGESTPGGRAVIFIARRGESTVAESVNFSTEDGTATAGSDYTPVFTTVTFSPGETNKAVAVPILDDTQVEDNETVTLHLDTGIGRSTATLTIFDNDFAPGVLSIVTPSAVNENAGIVSIPVIRNSGKSGAVSVNYRVTDLTATGGQDYIPASGVLTFQEGEIAKAINVGLIDDKLVEGNESFQVQIFGPGGGAQIGTDTATVTILDDDIGPGSLDTTFNTSGGASGPVRTMELQPDGKILLGGDFASFGGFQVNDITRLNPDGSLDQNFSTGGGSDGAVFSLSQKGNGKIGFAGSFISVGGLTRPYLVQTLTNGLPDVTLNKTAGENARILSIVAQPDGKYVAGGDFTTPAAHIMRINSDGSLDVSFNPDSGTDGVVNRVELQPDGRVLVGGNFTKAGIFSVRSLTRLMPDGLIDASFKIGTGVAGVVNAITLAPDGKILIGGDFSSVNGTSRSRLARLNADGTVDLSFAPASPNGAVNDIITYKGKIYIGGSFTTVGNTNRVNVARLNFDGSLDTDFDPGIGPDGPVYALAAQSDGSLLIAGGFNNVNGLFTPGIARLNGTIAGVSNEVRFDIVRVESGSLVMNVSTAIGETYRLEGSTDLKAWSPVETKVASSTSTEFRAPISGGYKFYRILVNP